MHNRPLRPRSAVGKRRAAILVQDRDLAGDLSSEEEEEEVMGETEQVRFYDEGALVVVQQQQKGELRVMSGILQYIVYHIMQSL